MAIRAIVFDIGGVLEITPDGREPTAGFERMIEKWEHRLDLEPGELAAHLRGMQSAGMLGTISEEQWQSVLRTNAGMQDAQLQLLLRDFWSVYLGEPNVELADFLRGMRPRYRTALLSNSFIGAREKEQERYGFAELTDLIVYSHEEGVAKPDRRIFELTCKRLGVKPEEMIFLDDVEEYVAGAREAGIRGIRFTDNAQAMAAIETLLAADAS